MTVEQQTLAGDPRTLVNGKPLTDRQQHAFDLVRSAPYGIAADEVGAALHAGKGRHTDDRRCGFCDQEGRGVLRSKALANLVTRRRASGLWFCRDRNDALVEQHAPEFERPTELDGYDPQTSEIPW